MPAALRVAAIDCGTNSIRLLIADVSATPTGPSLVDVHREMRIVRLGRGVDATGRLDDAALERTRAALVDYASIIRASAVEKIRMTATSATRDATNAADFTAMAESALGQGPEVIAGTEEAALSFAGAVGDLPADAGPYLVFDIGGGSTEFVIGAVTGGAASLTGAVSRNIGSVRITERTLLADPPAAAEVTAAREWAHREITAGLDALGGQALSSVRRGIAVAGTATTVAAAALCLDSYQPTAIHLARFDTSVIRATSDALLAAPRSARAAMGFMHPGRVDVIGGGSLILAAVAEALAARCGISEITVSEHDILDGIARSLA